MDQNVGVIVARFQVPDLHPGHLHLIDSTLERYPDTLVVLGEHGGLPTDINPLTFEERAEMVLEHYPTIRIDRLRDHPFDHMRWSDWLDQVVGRNYPGRKAVMCGSRLSFLDQYTGKSICERVDPINEDSGTAIREALKYSSTMGARARMIHHQQTRNSIGYSAADIAIVDDEHERVLAITKHWFDGLWSLPGGFLDPGKDSTDEDTARRERGEELLNIVTGDVYEQLGSRIKVDDPRYRGSKDKILSALFCTQYLGGVAQPGDDAKGARWMSRSDLDRFIVPWHKPLVERITGRWDLLRAGKKLAAAQ